MPGADLTLFAHLAARPDPEIDLLRAALVVAEPEYPGLDVPRFVEAIDGFGAEARRRLDGADHAEDPPLRRVTRYLHDELGFAGNAQDYYDPRNSFLNEVIERRVGIPITLAVVILEVAARAGVDARGVSFPGHFLVRAPGRRGETVIIDPFDGRIADAELLRELHARASGTPTDPDPRLLEPVGARHILLRMLNNLRGIYTARGDAARLRLVLERMQLLSPSDELERQLAQLRPHTPPPRVLN